MGKLIRKCPSCGTYTLRETCPKCGQKTRLAHPPPFSMEDKYMDLKLSES